MGKPTLGDGGGHFGMRRKEGASPRFIFVLFIPGYKSTCAKCGKFEK